MKTPISPICPKCLPAARDAAERACAVPLLERLRSVPQDWREIRRIGWCHHRNVPYGHMLHEAADEITSLTAQLAEARKDSERLDWLEAHRHVSLRHWTNGCIVELFDEKYWHDRHNQRDERFCDNYRQLLDHQLKDAALDVAGKISP